jgi:hypothetical protein
MVVDLDASHIHEAQVRQVRRADGGDKVWDRA